jgi:hypothetical protein
VPYEGKGGGVEKKEEEDGQFNWMERLADSAWMSGMCYAVEMWRDGGKKFLCGPSRVDAEDE